MKYIPGEHKNPPHFHDFDDNLILPNKGQEDKVTLSQLTITKKEKNRNFTIGKESSFCHKFWFSYHIYLCISMLR